MKKKLQKLLTLLDANELEMEIVEINKDRTEIIEILSAVGKVSVKLRGKTSKSYFNTYNSEQDIIYRKNNGNWIIKIKLIKEYLLQDD